MIQYKQLYFTFLQQYLEHLTCCDQSPDTLPSLFRYQTSQQTIENEKKAHFTSTQRQAKSALVSKILKEEKALGQ